MLGFIVDRKKRCDWNKRANLNDKHGLTCEFILCLFYLNLLKQINFFDSQTEKKNYWLNVSGCAPHEKL